MAGEQQGESGTPLSVNPSPEKRAPLQTEAPKTPLTEEEQQVTTPQPPDHAPQITRETAPTSGITTKVVDANGKPLTVYHGTGATFEKFEQGRARPMPESGYWQAEGLFGPGIYLTESKEIATSYAGKGVGTTVKGVNLDIRNPFVLDAPISVDLIRKLGTLEATPEGRSLLSFRGARTYKDVLKVAARESPTGEVDNDAVWSLLFSTFLYKDKVTAWLKANGYDGISHIGGAVTGGQRHRVWIAFDVSQIQDVSRIDVGSPPIPPKPPAPAESLLTRIKSFLPRKPHRSI